MHRQRRLGLAALAVVLVVGFGALAGALVLRSGDRSAVVTVVRPVPAGAQIERADLGIVDAAIDGIPTVPAADITTLVGRYATVPLISGTLLPPLALSRDALPGKGQAVVGLKLAAGQFPNDGLRSGDILRVIQLPGEQQTAKTDPVLVPRAKVLQSRPDAVNGSTSVTVLVQDGQATALTIAAAKGQVAVARVVKDDG